MTEAKSPECGVGFEEVFRHELEYVEARWRTVYGEEHERRLDAARPRRTTAHGLVGLAFSGGGIRSATINMGIAQALHRRGVFQHADYLSTVSGGGYLGSSISTAMRALPQGEDTSEIAAGKGEFPYAVDYPPSAAGGGAVGSPFLTWVRNNSNYMATGGFLDFARIFGVLLRGILVNFLVLLPILLLLAVGLWWAYDERLSEWNALRSWNLAVASEREARLAEAEATRAAIEGGAAAVRAREAAEEGREAAAERWRSAATAAALDAMFKAEAADRKAAKARRARAGEARSRAEAGAAAARIRAEEARARERLALSLAAAVVGAHRPAEIEALDEPGIGSFFTFTPLAAGLFVFLAFVFPVVIRVFKAYRHGEQLETGEESTVALRSKVEMAFAYSLVAIGVAGAIEFLPILIHHFHQLRDVGWRGAFAGAASGGALAAISAVGRVLSKLDGVRRKLVLLAVGLLGLVIPLVVVLYVTEGLIYGSWGAIRLFAPLRPLDAPPGVASPLLWWLPGILLVILGGGTGAAIVATLWERPSRTRTAVSALAVAAGAAAAYFLIHWWSWLLGWLSGGPDDVWPIAYVVGSAAVVLLFCFLAVDVNLTGVLGLYRDRLASAYLIGVRKKRDRRGKLETDEHGELTHAEEMFVEPDLNLQDLCGGMPPPKPAEGAARDGWQRRWAGRATRYPSKAPYHLVNTSLNLQGSSDPMLRDRHSDFLMFSKCYYGGERTGYCTTRDMEQVFPQMDLPTAMAISAAAASPNAGKMTNKPLVALMTLFNVRLGYWVPHPGRLCEWLREKKERSRRRDRRFEPTLWHRFWWRIPPRALLREMAGAVDEEHWWVNLSDGGHIENLAVYELLRRRCRYIICGDGEADSELTFGGLATLMRFARIDMNIEIEILLDDLRLDKDGTSHQHAALGRIVYPPLADSGEPEIGYLLYIKSSFTGNEDETMQEYRAQNPAFPHESTADQFFDEGQFEAYRALGFHMADGLFPAAEPGQPLPTFEKWDAFTDWFKRLRADLAPRLSAKHVSLQDQLGKISELLQREEYRAYFYSLHPTLDTRTDEEKKADREKRAGMPELTYLLGLQLDLMENAFLSLDLDQPVNWNHPGNQGWRSLFEAWTSKSEDLVTAYCFLRHLRSGRFQNFCERTLGLPSAETCSQLFGL